MAGQDAQPPANFPFSRYKGTDEVSWEQNTRTVMGLDTALNGGRKTQRQSRSEHESPQMGLFAVD
jgi:hypothetical protein